MGNVWTYPILKDDAESGKFHCFFCVATVTWILHICYDYRIYCSPEFILFIVAPVYLSTMMRVRLSRDEFHFFVDNTVLMMELSIDTLLI